MSAILLVCAANRCRSPLAAAILSRLLADYPDAPCVESAGLYARPGLAATADSVIAAAAVGLDLSTHRSRSLTKVDLAACALVLTMEEIQAETLHAAYPALAPRIVPLGKLLNLHLDIEDPTGLGLPAHHALVRQLERYLPIMLPQLILRV